MFKVNNKDPTTTPMVHYSIVNFEHILHVVLVFPLLTLSEQVNAGSNI